MGIKYAWKHTTDCHARRRLYIEARTAYLAKPVPLNESIYLDALQNYMRVYPVCGSRQRKANAE